MRNFGLDHRSIGDGGEVVGRQPFGGVAFAIGRNLACLERLECGGVGGIVVIADLVKVPLALVEGQILAPPVRVALVACKDAKFGLVQHIGAGTDGQVLRRFSEILALPLRLFQDRAQTKDQRQFAVFDVEGELHRPLAGLFHRGDLFPGTKISRSADCAQSLHRPHNVFDRDGRTVRESGLGAEGEFDVGPSLVRINRFGQKAVKREGFIIAAAHQRLDRQGRDAGGCAAFGHIGVEAVKAAGFAPAENATLGGIGVDLRQGHKIRGQGRGAIHSYAMLRFGICRGTCQNKGQGCRKPVPPARGGLDHRDGLSALGIIWHKIMTSREAIQTFSLARGGETTI